MPETYVHRIGRTARAGAEGIAISLVAGAEEMAYLRDIERLIRQSLPREDRRTPGGREAPPRPPSITGAAVRRRVRMCGRSHDGAPAAKGPRRRRRGGGNNGASQTNRQEPHRAPEGGQAEGLQGVAFLHRESRPNHKPNRNQKPN